MEEEGGGRGLQVHGIGFRANWRDEQEDSAMVSLAGGDDESDGALCEGQLGGDESVRLLGAAALHSADEGRREGKQEVV